MKYVFIKDYQPTIWSGIGQIMKYPGIIPAGTYAYSSGLALAVNINQDILWIGINAEDMKEYLKQVEK